MENRPRTPESSPTLRYPEGWREILEAPDAADYQAWVEELPSLTQQRCRELNEGAEWAANTDEVRCRWQQAIELVADATISPQNLENLTGAEIIETALLTLEANISAMGWEEEGLAFTMANMFTGEEAVIDLRQLPVETPNNDAK